MIQFCMTDNRFSDFHCVYTFMQVVHTEFIKVVRTDYSAIKSINKMSQDKTVAAVIFSTNSRENQKRKNKKESRYETVA